MQIGLNGRRLEGQRLGVGRYLEYLLKCWDRQLTGEDRIKLFVRSAFDKGSLGLSDRVEVCHLRPRLTGATWENLVLPRQASQIDVLFCPSYTAPLRYSGPLVVANHSVNESDPGSRTWKDQYVYGPWYERSLRKATRVIVPASVTQKHVQETYSIPPERIHIVAQGADDAFRPLENPELVRETRRKYLGCDVPYLLFVGKLSARRNIPTLIRAFARLKRQRYPPHKLLLVGPNHHHLPLAELVAELDLQDSVVQTDGRFTEHAELVPIYNAADIFVQPSLYEGFSMTTVEAFACGVPVIAANRGGLGELAGRHALMVDNPTEEALAAAIDHVLRDPALGAQLRRQSLERAKDLRWDRTARETLAVLRLAAADSKPRLKGMAAREERLT